MTRFLASIIVCGLLSGCAGGGAPAPTYRSDDLFNRVQAGMTREDVRALLGPPHNTMDFPRSDTTSWGYFGYDTWGYYVEYSVTYNAQGRVLSKTARRIGDRSPT
ncbi:MAG TPA: outer membrane protein assembly factor BamE [Usitatibacter sp.]|nr:outer membrane protein assembly factor BamE [Usitatibacter sp.]